MKFINSSSTVAVRVIFHEMELYESKFGDVYLHTQGVPLVHIRLMFHFVSRILDSQIHAN